MEANDDLLKNLQSKNQKLQKVLECEICLSTICNPKQLKCDHTFCKNCLDKILAFSPDGSATIKCPNGCHIVTPISPTQTTGHLSVNYMVKSMVDVVVESAEDGTKCGKGVNCDNKELTKYCIHCSTFICSKCPDILHDDKADAEEKLFYDNFVPVSFDTNHEHSGVIFCQEHCAEAQYACCKTQPFICSYCAHRGIHRSHQHEPLSQVEKSLRERLQKKVDGNLDWEKRKVDAEAEIKFARMKLIKELESIKLNRLMHYYNLLVKEETKIKNKFEGLSSAYLAALESVKYYNDALEKDKFDLLLSRKRLSEKLETIYFDTSDHIPGADFHLEHSTAHGARPFGSLKESHCIDDSCKRFKFDVSPTTIIERSEKFRSMVEFVKKMDDDETEVNNNPIESKQSNKKDRIEKREEEKEEKDKYYVIPLVQEEMESEPIDLKVKPEAVTVNDHICEHVPVASFPVTDVVSTITCTFQVNGVSKIHDREKIFSEPVVMQDFVFEISFGPKFETKNGEKIKYAGIYLYCSYKGYHEKWTLPIFNEISIMKNAVEKGVSESSSDIFSETTDNWGWPTFTPWNHLLDRKQGYDAVDDSITINAVITINNKDLKTSSI